MAVVLGTVGSEVGSKLYELGIQLVLLGGVALFLGSVRLLLASKTTARMLLAGGLLLLSIGLAARTFEHLGALQLNYYPGWKSDLEGTFLRDDPDLEFSSDDLEVGFGEPSWWEGLVWWGQRVARAVGLGLAGAGFVMDGRDALRGRGKKRKRAAR